MRHPDIDPQTEALAKQAIGAGIEVHRHLGPGYLETIYQNAMQVELKNRKIACQAEHPIRVQFKGIDVGVGRIDLFLPDGPVIIELKAVDALHPVHDAQVISYLRATRSRLGLLMNFRAPTLSDGLRRIVL